MNSLNLYLLLIYKMTRREILIVAVLLIVSILLLCMFSYRVVPYKKNTLFPREYPYEAFSDYAADAASTKAAIDCAPANKKKDTKTEGFDSMPADVTETDEKLDFYSQLESGSKCKPSPYSNSKGYLCMTQEANDLLITRGGNATNELRIQDAPKN